MGLSDPKYFTLSPSINGALQVPAATASCNSAKCQLPLVAIAIEMSYVLFCDNVGGRQLTTPMPHP